MTCATCDDCPQDAWHLHVTVRPHWSWTLKDVASALQRDVERHGVRPIVVTNHFRTPGRPPYKELIPTKHFRGTETDASREIFKIGVLLNNSGWRVRRLKIEGDARTVPHGRALYYEAHVRDRAASGHLPWSVNAKGEVIYTARRTYLFDLNNLLDRTIPITAARRIEAAVLDTRPELDEEWINER